MGNVKTILVAGATGMMGQSIIKALRSRGGCHVKAMYRSGKEADAANLQQLGAEPVMGDLLQIDTLADCCEGVDTIVSAVQGGANVVIEGQQNLIQAADIAGVPRFIPSDFSIDLTKLDDGDNAFLDLRRHADRAFARSKIAPTPILNGAFMHMLVDDRFGSVNWQTGEFPYWGDGDQPCDYTSVDNTAQYTAAAALDDELTGRPLRVAGDVLTMLELKAVFEDAIGKSLIPKPLGTVDELREQIEQKQQAGAPVEEYVYLQYQWSMLSGKAKLDFLENDRYPEIQPQSVREYLQANQAAWLPNVQF